jgi:hypothetical protein
MTVDKKINYEIQGGVKNYRPSEMVTAPKIAKSSPDTPTAKLAYITPEEEKILVDLNLYGSLKGKPNRGPSGLPSLEGDFGGPGGFGGFQGGGDYSSAETGNLSGFSGTGGGPKLPPGVTPKGSKEAQDIRSAFIAAGGGQRVNPGFFDSRNTVSPAELARARALNPAAFKATRGGGLMNFLTSGGILGNIIRGLGQKFGFGKRYNEPTYDMSGINNTRVYENILGPSTNPNNLDIYNEFVDEDETEEITTLPNVGSFGIMPQIKPSQQFIEELAPNLADPVTNQVGNIDDLMAKLATNSPALAQLRSLQKKQVLSSMGGPEFTLEDQQKLNMLEQMETDPVNIYSQTV